MNAPRLARLLIRLAADPDHRDDALGDLEEAHARRKRHGAVAAWFASMWESLVIALSLFGHRVSSFRHARIRIADLRLGFRLIARQPLTALTATVALTVGIALANVGFAAVETLLFSRLPFEGGDRFIKIAVVSPLDRDTAALTPESYALIAGAGRLEHLGAFVGGIENATLPDGLPAELETAAITASSLSYIPGAPLRGRALAAEDGIPGAAPVTVISERFWRRSLNALDSVVGATITIGTTPRTIVGVMPQTFEFPNAPAAWVPLDERFRTAAAPLNSNARLFGVLANGATLDGLTSQLESLAPRMTRASGTGEVLLEAAAITDLGEMASPMSMAIIVAVLAILTVIAANVGNLVLVRSFARAREFAVRAALGASRARLVTQVMTEVLVIGVVAAALGSLIGQAILRQVNAMDDLPFWADFTGSAFTAAMVAGAALLATGIAGAWPALKATRQDALGGLRSDGRTSDVSFGRAAGLIVITQIALSVAMLHNAWVVSQSVRRYTTPTVQLPANVLTVGMGASVRMAGADARSQPVSAEEIERQARAMPGVIAAGLTTALPRHSPEALLIELESLQGERALPARRTPSASVTPSFFEVLGGSILKGRNFTAADSRPGAPQVSVVNEPFVRDVLAGASPIGRRFRTVTGGHTGDWITIVGVVPDLGLSMGDPALAAGFYRPLPLDADAVYVAMRTTNEPMTYAEPLRRWIRERDPGLVLFAPSRLEDVAADDRAFFAVLARSLTGIGAITLVLALVGVYSMMSLIITRRTREIGIRVALGATPSLVVRSVARRAAFQVLVGGVTGAVLARLSVEGRGIFVSRLGDGGTWTLPLVMGLLMLAGLAATWVPLRRALRIRPQEALKAE